MRDGSRHATRRGLTQSRSAPAIIARGRKIGRRLRLFRPATVSRSALSTRSSSSRLDPPRLFRLRFLADRATVLAGLARQGRPIQYAHVAEPLALWDVWTSIAADPIAFEPPSAGFALEWRTLAIWRRRGVGFATLTHAAGISSTGIPRWTARLPFDEPFRIPERTAAAIGRAKSSGGRIVAIGTTVVRALEAAANADGGVSAGDGVARGRIGRETPLRVVDAILTGVHQPGESHFELLRAFAPDEPLERMVLELEERRYRRHEFGDFVLVERTHAVTFA